MKRILFIALAILLFINFNGNSQIPEDAIRVDENSVFKDESGNIIQFHEAIEFMKSGGWTMDPVKDKEGKVLYFQLRKATGVKGMDADMPGPINPSELIGKSGPEFEMVDINGNTISSDDTRGKVVVFNFWFTTCKPCIDEIPELNEVYEKYKNNSNVIFASITFDEIKKVESFLEKHPLEYPVVAESMEIIELFGIQGFPTNLILDKEGKYFDYAKGGNPEIGQRISISIQNALDGKKAQSITSPKNVKLDPSSTFKLENGDEIPFEKATELLMSQKYKIVPQTGTNNEEYYLIKQK